MNAVSAPVRWIVPDLEPPPAPPPVTVEEITPDEAPPPPSLEELQAIRRQAHQAGYEEGLASGHAEGMAQGLAQGQGEVRRLAAQIEGILDNFTRPLARLESEVTGALGELAVRIAGHLLGRAYRGDPALLGALVAQALKAVGNVTREVEVRLHPDDLAVFVSRTNAGAALPPALLALPEGVRLTPDPALSRGDLRVHAESVRIDGSLGARLEQALEQVIQQTEAMS